MFSYIKGTLEEYWEDTIVVESGGIGWNIHVPLSVLDRLPHVGEQIKVYTSFQVKEDSMTLYGFFSRQDLKMFNQLLGVTGIGPKTAKRVILDLKDKISMDEVLPLQFAGGQAEAAVTAAASGVDGAGKEAIEALVALGYSPTEATKAVRQVTITEDMNSEAVLKASLKFLAF